MPRKRHEERSSSSSSSHRTEKSASRSRPAAARSRSPKSSARSASRSRSAAARSPERSTPSYSPPPKTEKSTPRTSSSTWFKPSPKTEKSTPSTPSYTSPPYESDHSYSSSSSSSYGEGMTYRVLDAIVDALKSLGTTKELPVAAPDTNTSASISCVTQAKAFQDCLDEFETDITKCQLFMNKWSQCKKKSSDSKLTS